MRGYPYMRKPAEFRTYPPLSSSAGWGADNNDNKNGDERHSGQEPAAQAFASQGWPLATMLVACLMLLAAPAALAKGKGKDNGPKVSPPLQHLLNTAKPSTVVDVIVQYRVTPQQKHLDRVTSRGGRSKRHLGLIKA